ncbi:MAG TPA: threonine synthase [Gemmatimonadales bacterium]|nr:threonine synthase [Gemmatimonadales bacterium]
MTSNSGLSQSCGSCGTAHPERDPRVSCAACGGLLELHQPAPTAGAAALKTTWRARAGSGVWRFQEVVLPMVSAGDIISHPEGNTPLLSRQALSDWAGIPTLRFKHEGHNPTGSFKDRGMTVAVTQARRIGARAVACASTGNTAASLAAYAAQAGIPALVLMPEGKVAEGKLAQSIAYGARVIQVDGDFDACLRLAGEAARELGVYLANSVNPFRLEGQKTIILEMLQQRDWEPPDWIAVPAGNLGNTAAFGKALEEAHAWGLIDRLPRLLAVQAAGAAPFAQAFAGDFRERIAVEAETIATAIRIGAPASWDRGVRAIRRTNGIVTMVTDDEILEAKAHIDAAGVGCEPASAASLAGIRRLARTGTIAPGDQVVAVLTGHLLKDPGVVLDYHLHREPAPARANRPLRIPATLRALERAMQL